MTPPWQAPPVSAPPDDDDWLAALVGRSREGAQTSTLAVAGLLREGHRQAAAQRTAPPLPDLQQLLARARVEGLFDHRRGWCWGCLERWQRWTRRPAWQGARAWCWPR